MKKVIIKYDNQIVRVTNDSALKDFISEFGKQGVTELSKHIRSGYKKRYDKTLRISTRSLATEIYGHFKLNEWTLAIERKIGKVKPTRWMERHMEVIDCGERDVDNNRFVWDLLSVLWKKR